MEAAASPFGDAYPRAAAGDLSAQREMVGIALNSWRDDPRLYHEALKFAEFWARCCVINGDLTDYGHLLTVVAKLGDYHDERGETDFCKAYAAEGLAILDLLADAGMERAGTDLNGFAEAIPLDAVHQAKILREMMA